MSTNKTMHASLANLIASGNVMTDNAKAAYAHGRGAGDDAFEYRRGSGASAVSFIFAVNASYNDNAPIQRGALDALQLDFVEAGAWPGQTRAATAPALASMFGRGYLTQVGGAYCLSQNGLARAARMLAEMGLTARETAPATAPATPVLALNAPPAPTQTAPVVIDDATNASEGDVFSLTAADIVSEETPAAPQEPTAPVVKAKAKSKKKK